VGVGGELYIYFWEESALFADSGEEEARIHGLCVPSPHLFSFSNRVAGNDLCLIRRERRLLGDVGLSGVEEEGKESVKVIEKPIWP
jgi:hypothetical protein